MKYLDLLKATGDEKKVFAGGQVPAKLTKPSDEPISELTQLTKPGSVSFASAVPPTKKSCKPGRGQSNLDVYVEKLRAATLSAAQEAARADVLLQLACNPAVQRAFVNRFEGDGTLIVTVGIRGVATGELRIPAERFNQACLDDYAMISACFNSW